MLLTANVASASIEKSSNQDAGVYGHKTHDNALDKCVHHPQSFLEPPKVCNCLVVCRAC